MFGIAKLDTEHNLFRRRRSLRQLLSLRDRSVCRCMPYLRNTIKIPSRRAAWVDAAVNKPSMLSYHAEHVLGMKVKGTIDVAVCSRASVASTSPQLGLLLLMELKKGESSNVTVQARATLLMASLHSPESRPILVSLCFYNSVSRSKNPQSRSPNLFS